MKRTGLLLAMMFVSAGLWAQTTAGSISLAGGLEYSSNKSENVYGNVDYSSSSLNFRPSAGYFVIDNLEVGLQLGIGSGKSQYEGSAETKNSTFQVGPFARYYKFTSNERFAFTGTLSFQIGSGTSSTGQNELKTGSTSVSLVPGFTYFLSDKWALDFQLQGIGFTSYDPNKDVDNNNQNTFTFGASSLSPSLGFRFFITK
ncbi:MAG: porin family protein [Cyclobacteriaceae bacterium]|nr:porin family protein [Cyclobacteriaceae bacterium]